ncbi:MAG TPA: hypothetical protein DCM45_07450, partial [Clostridiales bacterium]|nr:hypothetical protein [Clostridiales bacterium]
FSERSSDAFYRINDAAVRQGKVGLWYGTQSQLIGRLDDGMDLKAGMVVYGARQPINNVYGPEEHQNIEPYVVYQQGRESSRWIITDKMKEKDIIPLLTMLDYLYTTEGALLATLGLNKAQYEETQNELYTRYGLTEGSYYRVPDAEVRGTKIYAFVDTIQYDGGMLNNAVHSNRFFMMDAQSLLLIRGTEALLNSLDQWIWYVDKGLIKSAITNQITPDEQKIITKTQTYINEFMAKSVPPMIKGEKDPFNDADWQAYVKALNKYSPDKVTAIYQEKQDNLG